MDAFLKWPGWAMVAAMGQIAEAIALALLLVGWQVRQLITEHRHRKWDALQWSLELLDDIGMDVRRVVYSEFSGQVASVLRYWNLVGLAAQDGFLDSKLLFMAVGKQLGEVYWRLYKKPKTAFPLGRRVIEQPGWERAKWLIEAAYEWVLVSQPDAFDDLDE